MLAKNQIRKKKHLFNKKERDEFFGKNGTFSYRVDDSKVSVVPNIFLLQNTVFTSFQAKCKCKNLCVKTVSLQKLDGLYVFIVLFYVLIKLTRAS